MKSEVGLWIDHRKTIIVTIAGDKEEITQIDSTVDKHVRYSGAVESTGEDQRDRRFAGQLDKYYDEVITVIKDAKSILILGPGEAKGEFVKRLQHGGHGGSIVGIETVDKMTDRQIAARVRLKFTAKSRP